MKRPSYLTRLVDGVKGQPALSPPPVLFRPTAAEPEGFAESLNESLPARGVGTKTGPDSVSAHRTAAVNPAARALRFAKSSTATPSAPAAATSSDESIARSPTRAATESRASLSAMDGNAHPRSSASTAAPAPTAPTAPMDSARRTPALEVPPPDRRETRTDSRPRANPAAPATLRPTPQRDRASASSTSRDRQHSLTEGGATVRIGTLEVRIGPPAPPAPAAQKPAAAPRAPVKSRQESLARGFASFGMVQG